MLRRLVPALIICSIALAVPRLSAAQVTPAQGYTPPDDTQSRNFGVTIFYDYTFNQSPKTTDADGNSVSANAFQVSRTYVNFTGNISHLLSFRITPDISRLSGSGDNLDGSYVVRLKYGFIIKCDEVVKDSAGRIIELRCTADLESRTGGTNAGRKVKGTIHWVSAVHAVPVEARLYERLFTEREPDAGGDFKKHLNPHSLEIVTAQVEPSLASATAADRFQFERLGYFALDPDSTGGKACMRSPRPTQRRSSITSAR